MNKAEQNYRLLQEIEANRRFLLMAYQQNPQLTVHVEPRIRELIGKPAHGVDNNLSPVICPQLSERGTSLIELIMFIVIVSVALAGILLVMNVTTKSSADPLVHKQALAIAESLLEEVELMPFTYCDPDDATADTATSATVGAGACTSQVENIGPEAAFGTQANDETRYGPSFFDNVSDYHGFTMNSGNGGIKDITGTAVAALNGYSATVAVAQQALGAIPATESLLITVTVTGPDGLPVVVEGMRTRYAPRTTP
jgi:MSHA pilin protein MshD